MDQGGCGGAVGARTEGMGVSQQGGPGSDPARLRESPCGAEGKTNPNRDCRVSQELLDFIGPTAYYCLQNQPIYPVFQLN